ncbi:hypothetical protein A6R68_01451 [Neotoma lepida]|uniref:Oxaloacetate tautomerase FAHD1, mitochondrial n=1 Tax=Neotoma lepida TaxID=56216 RepID=A0A1A6GV05_NEOLE|nr:hypothetical protein A6R68_01451 [Neotoma lepida]
MASPKPLSCFRERGKNTVCVGRNCADHVKEMRSELSEPVLFLTPSTAHAPEGAPVLQCPLTAGTCTMGWSWECSWAGVVKPSSRPPPWTMSALCLDTTARDVQEECKKKGLPWTLAKSFKASCPVSALVPKKKIPEPHALRLWLKVNGELRQEGKTSPVQDNGSDLKFAVSAELGDMVCNMGEKVRNEELGGHEIHTE